MQQNLHIVLLLQLPLQFVPLPDFSTPSISSSSAVAREEKLVCKIPFVNLILNLNS